MKIVWLLALSCISSSVLAVDDVTARKNFGTELAGCSAYYESRAAAPGINDSRRNDFSSKSSTALRAAAKVTDNQFALTKKAEAQAKGGLNGALCDHVMANPNERFAYWRGH